MTTEQIQEKRQVKVLNTAVLEARILPLDAILREVKIVPYLKTYSGLTNLELREPENPSFLGPLAAALPVGSVAILRLHPAVRFALTLIIGCLFRDAVAWAGRWWRRRGIITRNPYTSFIDGVCPFSFFDDPLMRN